MEGEDFKESKHLLPFIHPLSFSSTVLLKDLNFARRQSMAGKGKFLLPYNCSDLSASVI